ncbi:hypothetical protein IQ266_20460 [filamentous cyanobacterium LEGE 11480]|uniref:Lipoprotein n=1 Tax=Romeriopsis navalis LEGE 11480 TaxID=2777977 RepID=A0A928VPI3_9CYAN|nr:hypothetical protein [Romeriopsis navalis]MBE9032115.1 hypothetical protein [Romeriopsis navalis LEGE 11480]
MKYFGLAVGLVWLTAGCTGAAIDDLPPSNSSVSIESQSESTEESRNETNLVAQSQVEKRQYVSRRFGFRFAYPNKYSLKTNQSSDGRLQIYLARQENAGEPESPYIALSIYENATNTPLAEVRDGRGYLLKGETRNTTVAGQEAIEFNSGGLYDMEHVMFKTPDGKQVIHLEVTLLSESGQDAPMRRDAQVILSSFGF